MWLKSGEVIFKNKSAVIVWIFLERNRHCISKMGEKNNSLEFRDMYQKCAIKLQTLAHGSITQFD